MRGGVWTLFPQAFHRKGGDNFILGVWGYCYKPTRTGPMRRYPVKEKQIGSAVSEIKYTHTYTQTFYYFIIRIVFFQMPSALVVCGLLTTVAIVGCIVMDQVCSCLVFLTITLGSFVCYINFTSMAKLALRSRCCRTRYSNFNRQPILE